MIAPRSALPLLLLLAGCTQIDPYQRAGAWRPAGSNASNLRSMVVVPSDLAVATPAAPSDGIIAAAAVNRLVHDNVRKLPDSGVAQITPVATGDSSAPSGTPSGSPSGAPAGNGN